MAHARDGALDLVHVAQSGLRGVSVAAQVELLLGNKMNKLMIMDGELIHVPVSLPDSCY